MAKGITCTRCRRRITEDHYSAGALGEPVCCDCAGHRHPTPEERLAAVAEELGETYSGQPRTE